MKKEYLTNSKEETRKLGKKIAQEVLFGKAPKAICLRGELGAGKTTFTQGFLEGFGAEGPFTSPTFLVMKEYEIQVKSHQPRLAEMTDRRREAGKPKAKRVYHVDAYRVKSQDILNLSWEEIVSSPENILVIEWADRIKKIIPQYAKWISFEWIDENRRKIVFEK